jgi:hypothetical protein
MRTALLLAVTVVSGAFLACNPCARVSNAEAGITEKSKGCTSVDLTWTSNRLAACEQGLNKCSPEDNKKLDEYAACLNNIPACTSGSSLSFGAARVECGLKLFGVSVGCITAVNGQ